MFDAPTKTKINKAKRWMSEHPLETVIIATTIIGTAVKVNESRSRNQSRNAYARMVNEKYDR